MRRISFSTTATAMLLVIAAGCSEQPPEGPPSATDVQASPTPPKAGKAAKEDVRAPSPPTKLE
jgi:hypothetical protein